jgi:hypothetical protein
MTHLHVARRLLAGSYGGIAGAVYGTIMVMATLVAGSTATPDAWKLATIVATTVLVLWAAHVYAHGLGESIDRGRRLDGLELLSIAHRELSIPLAAAGPVVALLLGAAGLLRETRAVWLAMGIAVATLAFQGVRYARVENLGRMGTFVAVALNLALGLLLVALKAVVAH